MLSTSKAITCFSLIFALGACGSNNYDLDDPNGKAEVKKDMGPDIGIDGALQGENDDPCDSEETWRCVYSERLGATVSQVCRSCTSISVDDAKNWQVCNETMDDSRWVSFNLYPWSCNECIGDFSEHCRASADVECGPDTCSGCCLAGKCVAGAKADVKDVMCGAEGQECMDCTMLNESCYGGECRASFEIGCQANDDCLTDEVCLNAECIELECTLDEECPEDEVCLAGICLIPMI